MAEDYKKKFDELLLTTAQRGGSDLHLSVGYYPTIRVDGMLMPMTERGVLDKTMMENMLTSFLNEHQKGLLLNNKEIDFGYEPNDKLRCRGNVYTTRGNYSATFRIIPSKILSIEELNLPESIKMFSKLSQGFVLVVGPNGHGKSTTMAAMIDLINHERGDKIVTIEDPIEYLFTSDRSIIDQREVYADTLSFNNALRSTFRENVNVIMVGEMRDYETMNMAVEAAETGHLVFASLHTNNAAQTVDRIISSFPASQQPQIITQLANTISGIISQRLVPRLKGGLIPAVEIMIGNSAVRTLIREGKLQQIGFVIETSSDQGMISMDRSLADLVRRREISIEQAEFYSLSPANLKSQI